MSWVLWLGLAWAEECGQAQPIAGSAGFANAQQGRQTNRNTYSAANFAERALIDGSPAGQLALEWNATLNAARVPTYCADGQRAEGVPPVQERSLDLYASNMAVTLQYKSFGAFYSASVTQSALDDTRLLIIPTLITQLYPMVAAPAIGIWQRGDGVSSYSLDWIGGAHVDTKWFGARIGYTGIGGLYGSVDERVIGIFGTIALPFGEEEVSPWTFLRAGVDRFDLSRLGAEDVGKVVGLTSVFFRDLPFGDEGTGAEADTTTTSSTARVAAASSVEGALADLVGVRLRTLHFEQKNIAQWVDADISYAIAPKLQVFDGAVAVHSKGYQRGRLLDDAEARRSDDVGWLVKVGVVQLPPQYTIGVEGGTYVTARAELRTESQFYFLVLFNDPEQLALYPFATNAVSLRVAGTLDFAR